MHDIMRQNVAARNDHLVYAFVAVSVVRGNDVLTFADAILYNEIQCTKCKFSITLWHFLMRFQNRIRW